MIETRLSDHGVEPFVNTVVCSTIDDACIISDRCRFDFIQPVISSSLSTVIRGSSPYLNRVDKDETVAANRLSLRFHSSVKVNISRGSSLCNERRCFVFFRRGKKEESRLIGICITMARRTVPVLS